MYIKIGDYMAVDSIKLVLLMVRIVYIRYIIGHSPTFSIMQGHSGFD